jgi:hypothetical protein
VSIREVLRGIHHWTTVHPAIHIEVSAYLVDGEHDDLHALIPMQDQPTRCIPTHGGA